MYHYFYLAGSLYFLAVWIYIFSKKPRWRKSMLLFGAAFLWPGIAAEYLLWTNDYWHPETITGTIIGPEDFIMAFTHVSLPAVIYKFVFRKGVTDIDIPNKKLFFTAAKKLAIISLLAISPLLVLVAYNGIHSFLVTSISMLLVGIYIAFSRNDLFIPMLWSAILMTAISFPVYFISLFVFPGLVSAFWDPSLSGYIFLGVPIEDAGWYFLLGFFMGGMYEFLTGAKLEDAKI